MSNVTRLQAVSSSLDTAINTANSLPDVGGGSGGSIETSTIIFTNNSDVAGVSIFYSDGNNLVNKYVTSYPSAMVGQGSNTVEMNCVVPSIFNVLGAHGDFIVEGDASFEYSMGSFNILHIVGDATITFVD